MTALVILPGLDGTGRLPGGFGPRASSAAGPPRDRA
jgi:hypothetical protein